MPKSSGTATGPTVLAITPDEIPARPSVDGPDDLTLESTSRRPDDEPNAPNGLLHNQNLRQFVKFCIVGASSTAVTFFFLNVCKYGFHLPLFLSVTIAFLLSVVNGFFWNRKWTFKKARANSAHEQSIKFLAVNVVGYLLTTTIVVLIVAHFTAQGGLSGGSEQLKAVLYNIMAGEKKSYPPLLVNGAQAAAVCIVVWWNYFANRHWTFRH